MPKMHQRMRLSREEERFLRHWMYDEVHFRDGPGPAKRLQVQHGARPAEVAALIAAAMPDPAAQQAASNSPPTEPPTWPWTTDEFRNRVDAARAAHAKPRVALAEPAVEARGSESTSLSLLNRLQADPRNPEAWGRFDALYRPLLRRWAARWSLQDADAEDIVQDVLAKIHRLLPEFQHNGRTGAFRSWVRKILANRVRPFQRRWFWLWRRTCLLASELEAADTPLSRLWDAEHDKFVVQRVWEHLTRTVSPRDKEVFQFLIVEEMKPQAVADRFGITKGAVYQIKSRVLWELREELQGLIDLN